MEGDRFYERIVDLMQNRQKSIKEYTYFWPKDEREEKFNGFVLNTLGKYIQAYDTLHLIKQHFTNHLPQNTVDFLQKLRQKGENQLAKAIALSAKVSAQLNEISKQLLVLKGNRIIADEMAPEKKVKRLVSILNALQCYIICTANEPQSKSKEYQPKQLKKYEVDRSNYLGNMLIEMKKIEDYKRQALTVRTIISKYYQLPLDSNLDSYCGFIEKVLQETVVVKRTTQQLQKAIKQTQNSKNPMADMRRNLQQLKETRLKEVLLEMLRISEFTMLTYAKSLEKNGMPKKEERETYLGNEKKLRETIDRLRVQNEFQEQQLIQMSQENSQLKQKLSYFNEDNKKFNLPNSIGKSALNLNKHNFM